MRNPFPDVKTVALSDGRKVFVPVYDFEQQFKALLENEDIVNQDNFIDGYFDKEILRPTKRWEDMEACDVINNLNTGTLYWGRE